MKDITVAGKYFKVIVFTIYLISQLSDIPSRISKSLFNMDLHPSNIQRSEICDSRHMSWVAMIRSGLLNGR